MILKQLIFWLLSSTVLIQALAEQGSELIPDEHQLPCDKKIAWFRNITEQTKKLYNEYSKMVKDTSPSLVKNDQEVLDLQRHINTEHEQFDHTAAELLEKYESDSKELHQMSNSTARLAFCQKEIKWYRLLNTNLTSIAVDLKSDVLKVLDHVGVSKDVRDSFDKTLSRLVNFLFIIDLTKNLFKEIAPLVRQSLNAAEDGVALEKEWTVNSNNELEPARNVLGENNDGNYFNYGDNGLEKKIEEDFGSIDNDLDVKAMEKAAMVDGVEPGEEAVEEGEIGIEPFELSNQV